MASSAVEMASEVARNIGRQIGHDPIRHGILERALYVLASWITRARRIRVKLVRLPLHPY